MPYHNIAPLPFVCKFFFSSLHMSPHHCTSFKCVACRIRRNFRRWKHGSDAKPWLYASTTPGTQSTIRGLGCKACRFVAKAVGLHKVPVKIRPLASGHGGSTVATDYALKRHAQSSFHMAAMKQWCGTANNDGSHPIAPSRDDFKKVVDHICKHGASAWSGISDVGGLKKLRQMIIVAANSCQRKDQKFFFKICVV